MYADLGLTVVAADLDPQANLTSIFLEEHRLEYPWGDDGPEQTVSAALQPLLDGTGDIGSPHIKDAAPSIGLIVGNLALSATEDHLSSQWPDSLDR